MSFEYGKLRGRIIERYGSLLKFSLALGVSMNTFSKKMNNKVRFSPDDIVKISSLLEIPQDEIGTYFFTEKV